MRKLVVWLNEASDPIIFYDVEEFYDNIKSIKIIQEEQYNTTTSVIYKKDIIRWSIIETR